MTHEPGEFCISHVATGISHWGRGRVLHLASPGLPPVEDQREALGVAEGSLRRGATQARRQGAQPLVKERQRMSLLGLEIEAVEQAEVLPLSSDCEWSANEALLAARTAYYL